MASGGGADDERAIGNSIGNAVELFCGGEDVGGVDGGTSFAKRRLKRVYQAEAGEAKVAHRACSSADVKRVAGGDKHDGKAIELGGVRQIGMLSQEVMAPASLRVLSMMHTRTAQLTERGHEI